MNVLSLFDGISCGQIALERAGIKVDNYFSSEVDTHAIKVTQRNYPNTIQLGSVIDVQSEYLPKVDLLIGGSPCQNFSIANVNRVGFESNNGKLFYDYVRLLNELKPRYFLYENVSKMKKEDELHISNLLGVTQTVINSALFSAQSRIRNYWTNIPVLEFNESSMMVKDIIDFNDTSTKVVTRDVVYDKPNNDRNGIKRIGYCGDCRRGNRVYSIDSKGITLTRNSGGLGRCTGLYKVGDVVRRLSPLEAERMQTLPDYYTDVILPNARYQAIGNGWTVDVIAHIFRGLHNV